MSHVCLPRLVWVLALSCLSVRAGLIHRYSFTADANDSVGTAHGQLVNGATLAGGAVVLNGTNQYVNLPNGLFSNLTSLTLEAWLVDNGSGAWARIFDFGSSGAGEDFAIGAAGAAGTKYAFLSPYSSYGNLRGSYSVSGGGAGEQLLQGAGRLPVGVLKHVVWTTDGGAQRGWLYVDGELVGTNDFMTITPNDLEPTVNNWLGRSQFNDPFLNGRITEFRMYDTPMSGFQAALNAAAGPDALVTNAGPLLAIRLQVSPTMVLGGGQQAIVTGDFANVTNVNLTSSRLVSFSSSDTNVVTVDDSGRLQALDLGTVTITAAMQGQSDARAVSVSLPPQTLTHRYSFTSGAQDSIGTAHGTLVGVTVANGAVRMTGASGQYVNLPAGLLNGVTSLTMEFWASFGANGNWSRVYDFGDINGSVGRYYVMFTPHSSAPDHRQSYADADPGYNHELTVSGAGVLDYWTNVHVACVYNPQAGFMGFYTNGVLANSRTDFTFPLSSVSNVYSFLGRSLYSADAYLNGSIDEFRIYNAALTAEEIQQNYQLGPDVSPQSGPVAIVTQPASRTVNEQQAVSFSVSSTGVRPITFQWFRDGGPIPGATNPTYRLASAWPADNGAVCSVALTNAITNTLFYALSSNAVLTVVTDTVPPAVSRAFNVGPTTVRLVFAEPVEGTSATNVANYVFPNGTTVSLASLAGDRTTVTLTVSPLVYGSNYTVLLSGIRDRATTPNTIAPNTPVSFMALPYAQEDVGGATPPGSFMLAGNGLDVTGSGADIGGTADQFSFVYQQASGDFDVQARVQGMTSLDLWTQSALMARETLDAGSAFAASVATPGLAGSFFEYRAAPGNPAVTTGSFPANYPYTWLRLQRGGDVFSGYASFDGQTWTLLSRVTMALSNTLYLGVAVASHANGQSATVQVRDLGATASPALGPLPDSREPLGPCTRRTGIVISEIMYRPLPRADGRNLEFIELYNSNPFFEDLSGWRLSGSVNYTFPANTRLEGGSFLVVAANPADVQAIYGLSRVFGPYVGTNDSLQTSGTLRLRDEQGTILLDINYANSHPWPMAADGTGHSIVLARPSYGENDARAWDISDVVGGSPGTNDIYRPSPVRSVVINEVLANAGAAPTGDYIELYNHSNASNDLSGCILTDNPATNKFVIPPGTVIPPRGFLVFQQSQVGFGLKGGGDTAYLKNPDTSRVLDAVRFDAQAEGVSLGRWPDGARDFYPMANQTPGAANGAFRVDDIVINEIMYHPISKDDDDQFIELHNQGTNEVSLGGWSFTAGVRFIFPSSALLAPGGYLVVARNLTNLLAKYPNLGPTNTVGNFAGALAHNGERLALARPEYNFTTNAQGVVTTNVLFVVVDEVTYGDGGRWGEWADGGGSSLELIDPRANHRLAAHWADSDETAKAPWTTIETYGTLDHGENHEANIAYAQIGQVDAGECLLDDVEVRPSTAGPNYVANPGFDSGLTNWWLLGCFSRSSLEPGAGFGGSGNALRLRTANRLFTLANAAQCALNNTTLAAGSQATLRFKARWLRGCPDVVLRLSGNWLEAAGTLQVPRNLGTPGAPNSRAAANAGPALFAVTHTPALPGAGEPAVVTARAQDPDGVANLTLQYRIEPAPAYTPVPMLDDGTGGDAVSGDGVFSATIPGQPAGVLAAFIVTAGDSLGAGSRFPAPATDNGPERECAVRFGDPQPASGFGTYHHWITQRNVDRWIGLPVLSNEDIDGTLVYNNRVIYNMTARYAGSPYHQGFTGPAGYTACHYTWSMPKDDKLLGHASFNKMHWIGNDIQDDNARQNNNDNTLQREQTANTLLRGLGLPWVYRRYVAVYVNGVRRGQLMEDALRPSVSVPDAYFPDEKDGYLYKIQPWFEGSLPQAGGYTPWSNRDWSSLMPFTSGGAYKQARYRWIYEPRESPASLNDFSNVFALVTAANAYTHSNYVSLLQSAADMENWLRLVAANHAAGNWDCYGIQNQQNVYGYVGSRTPWTLFMFDFSIVLGNRIAWAPGTELETVVPGNSGAGFDADLAWQRIYSASTGHPAFRRMYWRALKELVNGALQAGAYEPILDAKYAAFRAGGVTAANPQPVKDWLASARNSIAGQVATRDTAQFTLASNTITTAASLATLAGRAPLEVASITVDGNPWPLTWSTLTNWTLRFPVPPGTNVCTVLAYDRLGRLVGGTNQITVVSTAPPPDSPVGKVVLSEIMFQPALPDAEYVELFNLSTNTAFDLSGWRFNGLSYTFPKGSFIPPRGYLVLARSRNAFALAYGATNLVFDTFGGNLQSGGETLTLLQPGATPAEDVVMDRVRYEDAAPWPAGVLGSGYSLQLIDPAQDNSRVSNWGDASGWRYATITGTLLQNTSTNLLIYMGGPGEAYVDDIVLVRGTVPGAGENLIQNGDFESDFSGGWSTPGTGYTNSAISTAYAHSGNASLRVVATASGTQINCVRQVLTPPTSNTTCTLSYWYRPSLNGSNLTIRPYLASGMTLTVNLRPVFTTPGASNSVAATLPAYPPLWLNEVQPVNLTGPADGAGDRDPWLELYNAGTNAVSLDGFYLADNYTNLTQWAFPANAVIGGGAFLVVWADNEADEATPDELHAGFRLAGGMGSVALSRLVNGAPQLVDYLNFTALPANASYGDVPDGQPFYRDMMYYPTPGTNNNAAQPPLQVRINEWMAANNSASGIYDPADGRFQDWFELYNAGLTPADLAGHYLTDTLLNRTQFQIPAGYTIPPRGFLLVWADNESWQNSAERPDLHVNFALRQEGEAIALLAPDGLTLLDHVTFGVQSNNVSQGRYPDGAAPLYFMPTPTPRRPNVIPQPPAPPEFGGITLSGSNQVSFSFSTLPGQTYRVEYKGDLNAPQWLPLGPGLSATGTNLIVSDTMTATQRFYRVLLVP